MMACWEMETEFKEDFYDLSMEELISGKPWSLRVGPVRFPLVMHWKDFSIWIVEGRPPPLTVTPWLSTYEIALYRGEERVGHLRVPQDADTVTLEVESLLISFSLL